jgi:hypothetical protein
MSLSLILRSTVSQPVCLAIKHPSGAYDQIFITVRQLRVCWFRALSLMRGQICHLRFLLALASAVILRSQSLGTRDHILLSQFRDFPFRRLVWLAGLRWWYSTPPTHGMSLSRIKVILRPTVRRPVCLGVKHPSRAYDRILITVRQLRVCWCGALPLMRERVCCLQLLLVLARAVILGSESRGTRDHILLSQIRESPNLESQVPVFISPRNRVAQLKSKSCYNRQFSWPVRLEIKHPSGA